MLFWGDTMDWNSAILWGLIGIACTIFFGFLFSYIFYRKGLKKKQLSYWIDTSCLISDKTNDIKGLHIEYNSYKINSLYSSSIGITNVGNSIINKDDFAQPTLISFNTDGIFIKNTFQNSIISNNEQVIANLIYNENANNLINRIDLDINYFSKKTHLKCEFLHTGSINFQGALKDGTISNYNEYLLKYQRNINILKKVFIVIVSIAIIFLIYQLER